MVEYSELIAAKRTALDKLEKDFPELILEAKEWTAKNGLDPENIIEIGTWIMYSQNIRGYQPCGSYVEKIYIKEGIKSFISSSFENIKRLGKALTVNGNNYHLEIVVST